MHVQAEKEACMEIYSFNIKNVEHHLHEIRDVLHLLYFAVYGLNKLDHIDDNELTGFEAVILHAREKTSSLLKAMRAVGE